MKTAIFSAKRYDQKFFKAANEKHGFDLTFVESPLNEVTALIADGFECVCAFVNDHIDANTLQILHKGGTRLIALRCAGYNNVDLSAAKELGLQVVRVPAYSPYGVAEHVIALLMAMYRTTHRSFNRIREGNFSLEGMIGHEVFGKTVGIIGTGKIGAIAARLFFGFQCKIIAHDLIENPELKQFNVEYVSLDEIWKRCDIISLHCPLVPKTRHLINDHSIEQMKQGVTIINTSRGALIDTSAVIRALKQKKIGFLGIDVYEEEDNLFFEDLSSEIIQDDVFMRLTTFPNVFITGHQAFFTETALRNIADTSLDNIREFMLSRSCKNSVFQ